MIVLDLPAPPSVNRTRRIDWRAGKLYAGWTRAADALVNGAKQRAVDPIRIKPLDRFELTVTMSEAHTRIDLDNGLKWLIDYLRRIELIVDDGPQNMRKLTVVWGLAPLGCRVTLTEI